HEVKYTLVLDLGHRLAVRIQLPGIAALLVEVAVEVVKDDDLAALVCAVHAVDADLDIRDIRLGDGQVAHPKLAAPLALALGAADAERCVRLAFPELLAVLFGRAPAGFVLAIEIKLGCAWLCGVEQRSSVDTAVIEAHV